MVSTMKKMATALQEEQPGRSLVKAFIPGLPWTSFCEDYDDYGDNCDEDDDYGDDCDEDDDYGDVADEDDDYGDNGDVADDVALIKFLRWLWW